MSTKSHLVRYWRNRSKSFIVAIIIAPVAFFAIGYWALSYISEWQMITSFSTPGIEVSTSTAFSGSLFFNNQIGEKEVIDNFVSIIDSSESSIDVAVFSFKSKRIYQALVRANERGVKVTFVSDRSRSEEHSYLYPSIPEGISRIDTGSYDKIESKNSAYMHHKFMIVDRGTPKQLLVVGAINFTDTGEKYNQSHYMVTSDQTLIDIYSKEFDFLANDVSGVRKLGESGYNPFSAKLNYTDGFLEVWMSPGFSRFSSKYRILGLIEQASTSIDVLMWDFTDQSIARALVGRALDGVHVRIIAESSNTSNDYSQVPFLIERREKLKLSNLEILTDNEFVLQVKEAVPYGFNPFLHHHTMIVDGHTAVFGTNNWSLWGFYRNDEDTMVSNIPSIVGKFMDTFEYLYGSLR